MPFLANDFEISSAFGPSYYGVQDLPELEALSPPGDNSFAFVESEGSWYFYDALSITAPSSPTVIVPDAITPPDPGRWIQSSAGPPPPHSHVMTDISDLDASGVPYAPGVVGDWASVPTVVAEALDEAIKRRLNVVNTAVNYLATFSDGLIRVAAAGVVISLPASPGAGDVGRSIVVKRVHTGATSSVSGNGNTIDGSASRTLVSRYDAEVYTWTGSEWDVN